MRTFEELYEQIKRLPEADKAKLARYYGLKPTWNLPEEPPKSGELVLLSFSHIKIPHIGRYIGDEENGGNFYLLEEDEPLLSHGVHVNGWMPLPECVED